MDRLVHAQQLLEKATAVLPFSGEEIVYQGITAQVSERMVALKRARLRLQREYGSLESLERQVRATGVSPDNHTLYTDLLEWRAINHELAELWRVFETL